MKLTDKQLQRISRKLVGQYDDDEEVGKSDYQLLRRNPQEWSSAIQGHLNNLHTIYLEQIRTATMKYFDNVFPNKDESEKLFAEELYDSISSMATTPMEFSYDEIMEVAKDAIK